MTTSNLTEMHHRVREGLEKLAQLAHQQAENQQNSPATRFRHHQLRDLYREAGKSLDAAAPLQGQDASGD